MASSLRLIRKVYRFEIASMTIAILLLTAAAVVITTHLDAFRPTLACWNQYVTSDGEISAGCEGLQGWLRAHGEAGQIKGALTFLPLISGALLGSVLVSREIEQRTTQLAWSLSGARRRWLLERVVPVGLLLVVLLGILAVAAERLEGAAMLGVDPRSSLTDYGQRGLPVVAMGLVTFSFAVLVGALVGRQLPALIVSCALMLLVLVGVNEAFPYGVAPSWVPVAQIRTRTSFEQSASVLIRNGWRATDGTFLTFDEAQSTAPPGAERWVRDHFTSMDLLLPGDSITEIELRETALLAAVVLLMLGTAFVVVDRRRPF